MATITSDPDRSTTRHESTQSIAAIVLRCLGSLKLTVALFAFSLIIVLVGTLAQDEMNMLEVKERYFLSWIALLHIDDLFPQAFFPHSQPYRGVIPVPGGALIGFLLIINLIAAKATRFKIHASGIRLAAGIGMALAGIAVAAVVIAAGHNSDGLQGVPPFSYAALWAAVLASLTVLGIGLGVAGSRISNPTVKWLTYAAAIGTGAFVAYCLVSGFRIGDPGLRIVWQLTKGLGAGVIMLVGCIMVFDRQGGNVLLHVGVGLLMVGQFVFGDRQLEQRLSLVEGQSSNTLVNLDKVEMTLIRDEGDKQDVIAIPAERLQSALRSREVIVDAALPVDIRVLAFYPNSTLKEVDPKDNLATTGIGLEVQAVEVSKSGGTDSDMNLTAAYVELLEKPSGTSLGTYLASQLLSDREMLDPGGPTKDVQDQVELDGQTYKLGLRLHREVKPYWVQLEDVQQDLYSGTATTRDYSSFIRIVDPVTGEDRRERVWMNNPLRYRGETFYQSSYSALPNGKELTGIQVVQNSGWLIPYVACSITALGMLAHFFGTLMRFLQRRERETRGESKQAPELTSRWMSGPVVASIIGVCALLGIAMLVPWQAVMFDLRPQSRDAKFDFYAAGKLPTSHRGRVMPLDSYARQTLKAMSNRESLALDTAPPRIQDRVAGVAATDSAERAALPIDTEKKSSRKKLSAMHWLMEVALDSKELRDLPMFRIDSDEVRSELGLKRRESKLYSLNEIGGQWDRVRDQVEVASEKEPRDRSFKERKLVELDGRTRQYTMTVAAFGLPIPEEISAEEFERAFPGATDQDREQFALRRLESRMEAIKTMSAPAIVAPSPQVIASNPKDPRWDPFSSALFDHYSELARAEPGTDSPPPRAGVEPFGQMIKAYGDGDPKAFNQAVDDHMSAVTALKIPRYRPGVVAIERWMQSNWPEGVAMSLYLIALVLGLVYLGINVGGIRRAAWGVVLVALVIHTIAIACRMIITGRAPVINIYSSAVFIGWAAVVFLLIMERIYRYGIGNVIAAAAGVMSLLTAYGLAAGDTMPVLEAVLDTQFWLSTHVISVTLGYVATMVAGFLGIVYLFAGWVGAGKKRLHDLYRCCYGAACFGILFSFVGTVLGGLWADDSWGRFWGWDPKENGALLIVIWNALMLHARWDGMVGPRGFASLAIGGNIVTAWSWFGTNELGIGFHSYGFTSGVLMWLSIFMAFQLVVIALDLIMRFANRPTSGAA